MIPDTIPFSPKSMRVHFYLMWRLRARNFFMKKSIPSFIFINIAREIRNSIQVVYGLSSIIRKKGEKLKNLGVNESQTRDLESVDD